jgi:hypothetical protein
MPFAQEIIAHHGMQDRLAPCPGNYFHDDFAGGNDLILLSNTLQIKGVENCCMFLGKVFKALAAGGQLLIHGITLHPDRVTPLEPVLFPWQMLLSFPDGDAYPAKDMCTRATEMGFAGLQVTRLPSPASSSLIMGRKPA